MTAAYIGLGSNLEDPLAQLRRAFRALERLPESRPRFYPDMLNWVVDQVHHLVVDEGLDAELGDDAWADAERFGDKDDP